MGGLLEWGLNHMCSGSYTHFQSSPNPSPFYSYRVDGRLSIRLLSHAPYLVALHYPPNICSGLVPQLLSVAIHFWFHNYNSPQWPVDT